MDCKGMNNSSLGVNMRNEVNKNVKMKLIIKKCHSCGQLIESTTEQEKCVTCGKAFLPLNYFQKIHDHDKSKYKDLFAQSHELHEDDVIKGLYVIW
jgi:hypothetical protein